MAIIPQPSVFDWTDVDLASDLDRLRLVLDAIPDERLMLILEAERGRGRDDRVSRTGKKWQDLDGVPYTVPLAALLPRCASRSRRSTGDALDPQSTLSSPALVGLARCTSVDRSALILRVERDNEVPAPTPSPESQPAPAAPEAPPAHE